MPRPTQICSHAALPRRTGSEEPSANAASHTAEAPPNPGPSPQRPSPRVHMLCASAIPSVCKAEIVVPPWDWTPGEVKARKYDRTKKGGYNDTATKIYRGVQSAGGDRLDQWSAESCGIVSAASAQPTGAANFICSIQRAFLAGQISSRANSAPATALSPPGAGTARRRPTPGAAKSRGYRRS